MVDVGYVLFFSVDVLFLGRFNLCVLSKCCMILLLCVCGSSFRKVIFLGVIVVFRCVLV